LKFEISNSDHKLFLLSQPAIDTVVNADTIAKHLVEVVTGRRKEIYSIERSAR
jgi:hypothetical protein